MSEDERAIASTEAAATSMNLDLETVTSLATDIPLAIELAAASYRGGETRDGRVVISHPDGAEQMTVVGAGFRIAARRDGAGFVAVVDYGDQPADAPISFNVDADGRVAGHRVLGLRGVDAEPAWNRLTRYYTAQSRARLIAELETTARSVRAMREGKYLADIALDTTQSGETLKNGNWPSMPWTLDRVCDLIVYARARELGEWTVENAGQLNEQRTLTLGHVRVVTRNNGQAKVSIRDKASGQSSATLEFASGSLRLFTMSTLTPAAATKLLTSPKVAPDFSLS
jgi:hypothetical protein